MIEVVVVILVLVVCFALVCFMGSPYVPTKKEWAKEALNITNLNEKDLVIDLGAGDGKILRYLAEKNIKSIGYEINPILVLLAKLSLFGSNYSKVEMKNYWTIDLPKETTVVYAFMVERDALKLEKYLAKQLEKVDTDRLELITFGFDLPSKKPSKESKISRLYIFE